MSNKTACRTCGIENTPGNKFCSNCGSKLPLSTHIICPKCQTSNSHDRVFCDKCGTRLIQDTSLQPPPESEKPAKPSAKAFTLPTRRPGETGELNPNTLPDWLRTGQTKPANLSDSEKEEQKLPQWIEDSLKKVTEDKEDLPKLEDLTPEKRTTDDLPDWLVNDSDSNPIIATPDAISTELYMDLMNKSDEDLTLQDSPFSSDEVELPDWLAEAGKLEEREPDSQESETGKLPYIDEGIQPSDTEAGEFDLPNWLADAEEEFLESEFPAAADSFEASGLTELLSSANIDDTSSPDLPDSHDTSEPPGLTRLLSNLDDSETGLDEENIDEDYIESGWREDDNSGLTGWLLPEDEKEPEDLSQDSRNEAEEKAASGLTDWLSELNQLADVDSDNATDSSPAADDADWLSNVESDFTPDPDRWTDWLDAPLEAEPSDEEQDNLADEILQNLDGDGENVPSDFSELFQVDTSDASDLPSWLADAAASGDSFIKDEKQGIPGLDDLFSTEEVAAQSELDWLMQTGGLSLPKEADEPILDVPNEVLDAPSSVVPGDLDWLSDLASLDTNTLQSSDELDDKDEKLSFEDLGELTEDSPPIEEEFPAQSSRLIKDSPPIEGSEWQDTESFLASESHLREELPDWMSELGDETESSDIDEAPPEPTAQSEEALPDWLSDIDPGESEGIGSSVANLLISDDGLPESGKPEVPDAIDDEPLPDWLNDNPILEERVVPQERAEIYTQDTDEHGIPEWLQLANELEKAEEAIAEEQEEIVAQSEWGAMMNELAPPDLPDSFTDSPDFLADAERVEELSVQEKGILAGLRGVIDIEPSLEPVEFTPRIVPLTVSDVQQQQVDLLQLLIRGEHTAETAVSVTAAKSDSHPIVRILLAFLLIGVVLAGLLLPPTLTSKPSITGAGLNDAIKAINAVSGKRVLVAFEYAPAMSGELTPQAAHILNHLSLNGNDILGISQYTAGTALAEDMLTEYDGQFIGFLPGEAIGLRQLGDCISQADNGCTALPNLLNDASLTQQLADVELIVVITGQRDNLTNWIEQVGIRTSVPMVVGVTQSVSPVALPYYDAGQISGIIDGINDTIIYAEQVGSDVSSTQLAQTIQAQTLGQALVIAFLMIGLVVYGLMTPLFSRSHKNKTA